MNQILSSRRKKKKAERNHKRKKSIQIILIILVLYSSFWIIGSIFINLGIAWKIFNVGSSTWIEPNLAILTFEFISLCICLVGFSYIFYKWMKSI